MNSFSQSNKKVLETFVCKFQWERSWQLVKLHNSQLEFLLLSLFFFFNQIGTMWREKDETWSIHGMQLQIINWWCGVILNFGTDLLLDQYISVFKNKICCTRQILLGNVAGIICLADSRTYAAGEVKNSSNTTVVNNSEIEINIEMNFNSSNSEVSELYNDALCMIESLGWLLGHSKSKNC